MPSFRPARVLLAVALAAAGVAVLPAVASASSPDPLVHQLVGARRGDGGPATDAQLNAVSAAEAPDGTVYAVEANHAGIRRIDAGTGVVTTLASSPAHPQRIRVDGAGLLYVLDNGSVYRLNPDGSSANFTAWRPGGIADFAVAADGTLYVAEFYGLVESIAPGGAWTLVAGGGGSYGEGGAATSAGLFGLSAVAVAPDGAVLVGTDTAVRRIASGVITTVAGGESGGADSGDGGPATAAHVRADRLAVAPDGTIYVGHGIGTTDPAYSLRRFTVGGTIETFATASPCLAGAPYVTATRVLVSCSHLDAYDTTTAAVTRVAGSDASGSPDGTPSDRSWEREVNGVALDAAGLVYYSSSDKVRRREADGTLTTLAGGGTPSDGYGDGPATGAELVPGRLATAPDGSVYVVDQRLGTARLRRIASGVVSTVAGGGTGTATDGASATGAAFTMLTGVAVDGDGVVWFADNARQVWRVSGGLLAAVGAPQPFTSFFPTLSYDPYAARMLIATGGEIDALASDGTRTPVAALSGEDVAAGPDGGIYGEGYAQRGEVRTMFFGFGNGGDGGPSAYADGAMVQVAVTADGRVVLADRTHAEVRVVDPLPAPDVPTVADPVATPGPGYVTFHVDRPTPDPAWLSVRANGFGVYDWSSTSAGDVDFTVSSSPGEAYLGHYAHEFELSFTNGSRDALVKTVVVTPLVDDVAPDAPAGLAADPVHDGITFTPPTARDRKGVFLRWASGTTSPATPTDGDGGANLSVAATSWSGLPALARYQDVAFSLWSTDYAGNLSAPATIVLPRLTLTSGGASPFTGYDSDEPNHTLRLSITPGSDAIRYAAGDTAPATVADGLVSSTTLTNLTFGAHYSLAAFTRTSDGLHYTRVTYRAVMGGNTVPDVLTMNATPGTVLTGTLVTFTGTVKQGGTNAARASSRVELWARALPATTYTRLVVGRTTATGAYSFAVRPAVHTYYQVRTGVADPAAPPMSTTAARLVKVNPKVTGRLSATSVLAYHVVRVYGTIVPTGHRTLVLQIYTSKGWVSVVTKTTDAYGKTYYDLKKAHGTYKLRWYAPASSSVNVAVSPTSTLMVS